MDRARRTTDRIDHEWIVASVFVLGLSIDIPDTTIVNAAANRPTKVAA